MHNTRALLSDAKFYESYSRWQPEKGRYETWEESVDRVMHMHRTFYAEHLDNDEFLLMLEFAESMYKNKTMLGAQRALQFGGEQLLKHMIRLYNCVSSHCDRVAFFQECMYMLLCGAGTGFSVQKRHIDRLPEIKKRTRAAKTYTVEDSIEGWSDAIGVLLSSYFEDSTFPDYHGRRVHFDLTPIRKKGSFISGGFKAPGPDPLRKALDHIELLMEKAIVAGQDKLKPIQAYDIVMHSSNAVLAGGVRRAATICLFDPDDEEMLNAKTGNWMQENPQRARSNNSAVLIRDETTREQIYKIMESVKAFGEPGFVFVEHPDFTFNPCVEIGQWPLTADGRSGWQGCNLTDINGAKCVTPDHFYAACKASAIIGTLQAGYTDFKYLASESKEIFEREALIGCSVTGWMNNPQVLLDAKVQRKGAQIIKKYNKIVAKIIGINPAARTTCGKPAGNSSAILGTASGYNAEHSPKYLRHAQMNKQSEIPNILKKTNPSMVEDSLYMDTDYVVAFPIFTNGNSLYRKDLMGVKHLESVKSTQQNWVEEGTNVDLCMHPKLRHNISNTITVDDWDEVANYVFENREWFAGISFLPTTGDRDYAQAPFTEIRTEVELVGDYGPAAVFASGLIVDGITAFNGDLWEACRVAVTPSDFENLNDESHQTLMQRDFIRRARKFAELYFRGDLMKMTYCLKDVHLLHKWHTISNNYKAIDWSDELPEKEYTDIDLIGAEACAGGSCAVTFQ